MCNRDPVAVSAVASKEVGYSFDPDAVTAAVAHVTDDKREAVIVFERMAHVMLLFFVTAENGYLFGVRAFQEAFNRRVAE